MRPGANEMAGGAPAAFLQHACRPMMEGFAPPAGLEFTSGEDGSKENKEKF
jgi:hypothetical protein